MKRPPNQALTNPEVRRAFEEEVLVGETIDTIAGILESLGLTQAELARRLAVTPGRVSQILSGAENVTLHTVGALGWALGVRFELRAVPMADRDGTPAADDPPAPDWISRLPQQQRPRGTTAAQRIAPGGGDGGKTATGPRGDRSRSEAATG